MSFEITPASVALRVLAMLAIITLHGFVLAFLARLLGDEGPKHDGRLRPNPFAHFDVLGLVAGAVALWGWMKPMRIDRDKLRGGGFGLIVCVLGSLLAVVVVCYLLGMLKAPALTMLPRAASFQVAAFLNILLAMSVVYAVVNLLPFKPFTGGHFLDAISPRLGELSLAAVTVVSVALTGLAFLDRGTVVVTWLRPLLQLLSN